MQFLSKIHCLLLVFYLIAINTAKCKFKLTIIHNNDFHSHYPPIDKYNNNCKNTSSKACFGGVARTVAKMKEIVARKPNTLFLNAGDHFQGTVWYSLKKWEAVAKFVKLMNHTAMALGNHEFDDGEEGLLPFLENITYSSKTLPVLSCNLKFKKGSNLSEILVKKSIILKVKDNGKIREIAVIGYTTPDTKFLARPGKFIEFKDEIESIKNEINSIKIHYKNVKIFIAVGHSGFEKDKEIAAKIPDLDVVVGGHTNTFLFSPPSKPPSDEKPQGPYPVTFNNNKTLVVQAFAYGKYLGELDVEFDENGEITTFSGNPILLDYSVKEDADTLKLIELYKKEIDKELNISIGRTDVELVGGENCRMKECNLGNVITDSFVDHFKNNKFHLQRLSIVNGGLIRAGIGVGNITMEDIISVCPFGNQIGIMNVSGQVLRKVFEISVNDYDPTGQRRSGRFLQMSRVRVRYDLDKPVGQRVADLKVLCADCKPERYEDVTDARFYSVITTTYIATGGDGYTLLTNITFDNHEVNDYDLLKLFITNNSPIKTDIENRISFSSAILRNVNPILIVFVAVKMFFN